MLRPGTKDSPGLVWLKEGEWRKTLFPVLFPVLPVIGASEPGHCWRVFSGWTIHVLVACEWNASLLFLMVWKQFQVWEQVWWGDPAFTCSDCSLEMKGTGGSIRNRPTHLCQWAAAWSCQAKRVAQHLQGFPTLSFSAKVSNKIVPTDKSRGMLAAYLGWKLLGLDSPLMLPSQESIR